MGVLQTIIGAIIALIGAVFVKHYELRSEEGILKKKNAREDARELEQLYSSICGLLPPYLNLRTSLSRHALQQIAPQDEMAGEPFELADIRSSSRRYWEMDAEITSLLRRIRIKDPRDDAVGVVKQLEKALENNRYCKDRDDEAFCNHGFLKDLEKIAELEEGIVRQARALRGEKS